ncbi:MAG TPA: LysE family transporter [Ktedonobacterales bacterium]|nr:LysE family transporter [Ktedonobacterales bacterium]
MSIVFLLRGLLIGLSIAAPVGPIGVLCIRRTLAVGRVYGLVSGLGAATADAFYGSVAGFGLTFLSSFLIEQRFWLRLIGGLFLCYLGVRTFLAQPAEQAAEAKSSNLAEARERPTGARVRKPGFRKRFGPKAGAYASTLLLTLTNPTTIFSFAAIFAGLGLASVNGSYLASGSLVLGVFLGSALWWFLLSGGISLFREKLGARQLRWINRLSGGMILAFGVLALASLWS